MTAKPKRMLIDRDEFGRIIELLETFACLANMRGGDRNEGVPWQTVRDEQFIDVERIMKRYGNDDFEFRYPPQRVLDTRRAIQSVEKGATA